MTSYDVTHEDDDQNDEEGQIISDTSDVIEPHSVVETEFREPSMKSSTSTSSHTDLQRSPYKTRSNRIFTIQFNFNPNRNKSIFKQPFTNLLTNFIGNLVLPQDQASDPEPWNLSDDEDEFSDNVSYVICRICVHQ